MMSHHVSKFYHNNKTLVAMVTNFGEFRRKIGFNVLAGGSTPNLHFPRGSGTPSDTMCH